jgi:hypothetical protein
MLGGIGKLEWVQEIIKREKSLTKYIYNHSRVLSMMRKFTNGKDIVHPTITRFATDSISLQCISSQKLALRRMFV